MRQLLNVLARRSMAVADLAAQHCLATNFKRPAPSHCGAEEELLAAWERRRLPQEEFACQVGVGSSTLSLRRRQANARNATLIPMTNLFGAAVATAG